MRTWLVACPMAAMAVAVLASGRAAPAEDSWCPLHPTEIMTTYEGASLRVVGASSQDALIEVNGERRSVRSDARYFFERAAEYAPGRIEIKDPQVTSKTLVRTNYTGRQVGPGEDRGSDFFAQLVATRPYKDCYIVVVFLDREFLAGVTDEPLTGFFFHRIGDLPALKAKRIHCDFGRAVPPRLRDRLQYFVLVFSSGVEIRTNLAEGPAVFFRRLEMIAHQGVISADRAHWSEGNRPPKAYVAMPPLLPDDTDFKTLPEAVHASLMVAGDGTVQSVDLREPMPDAVAREIRRTLLAWLFLPCLEDCRPVRAKVEAVVKVSGASPG